jgi:hypothetical protein
MKGSGRSLIDTFAASCLDQHLGHVFLYIHILCTFTAYFGHMGPSSGKHDDLYKLLSFIKYFTGMQKVQVQKSVLKEQVGCLVKIM